MAHKLQLVRLVQFIRQAMSASEQMLQIISFMFIQVLMVVQLLQERYYELKVHLIIYLILGMIMPVDFYRCKQMIILIFMIMLVQKYYV